MKKIISIILIFSIFIGIKVVYAEELNINSKVAIALDAQSGVITYAKCENEKIYPASTTKIMTAILAIENLDLSTSVTATKEALAIPWDSSSIYLKKNEILTVEELLYGLLLDSGNDAANVLAEAVSGSIENFVNLMNEKAKEIGCTNTHFNNAHGYSDSKHYTTALDMAKIFNYCIKNETFVKIISTKLYIIPETNKTNEKRYLYNTNRLLQTKEDSVYGRYYEYCIGGKTGFTDEAGRCLIAFATKDDKTIIIGVFGASSNGSKDVRYTDAINLFEYSFNNYNKITIAQAKTFVFNYINMEKELSYNISIKDSVEILAKSSDDISSITYEININDSKLSGFDINSEINNNIVGNILFYLKLKDGSFYTFTKDLYLNNIKEYPIFSFTNTLENILTIVLIISITLLIVFVIIAKRIHDKKKRKRKNKIKKSQI